MQQAITSQGMAQFSAGAVVNRSFSTLMKRPGVFIGLSFLVVFPLVLAETLATRTIAVSGDPGDWTVLVAISSRFLRYISDLLIQGAAAFAVYQVLRREKVTFFQALGRGMVRIPIILLSSTLAALGIALGWACLVVPGLMLMTMWSVMIPACVVEKTGPIASLGRSMELTGGYRWPIFGLIVAAWIVGSIFSTVGMMISLALLTSVPMLGAVLQALVSSLPVAFTSVMTAIIYYDLRAVKEGIAVESLANVFD